MRIAFFEEFLLDRFRWEIVISFNNDGFLTFRNHLTVPDGFFHLNQLFLKNSKELIESRLTGQWKVKFSLSLSTVLFLGAVLDLTAIAVVRCKHVEPCGESR